MARTIAQIQQSIIDKKNADATLAALNSTSNVAIWRLWSYVQAVAIHVLESLFDYHKAEVTGIIKEQKAHTLPWYVMKAKAYQHGVSLSADSDVYGVVPPVDESVLIITNAAVQELGNTVRLKVATGAAGSLSAISVPELTSFRAYINRIKDAGVRIDCTSGPADDLKLELAIYYDPLVLDEDGKRLDGTGDTPVKDAINEFLTGLPFNGLFVVNRMIDAIERVEGVRIGQVVSCQANYAATPYVNVAYEYTPDAGYMELNEVFFDANVSYNAHGPI